MLKSRDIMAIIGGERSLHTSEKLSWMFQN